MLALSRQSLCSIHLTVTAVCLSGIISLIDDQVDWHILCCYSHNHEVVLSAANLTARNLKSLWLLVYLQHTQRRRSLDLLVADVHPGQIKQPHHGIRCRLDTCSWNRIWRLLPLFPHSLFPLPLFLTLFIPFHKGGSATFGGFGAKPAGGNATSNASDAKSTGFGGFSEQRESSRHQILLYFLRLRKVIRWRSQASCIWLENIPLEIRILTSTSQ
jgi:hypothetical protein